MEISINMNVRIALIWFILGLAVSNVITSEEIVSHDEGNHHEQRNSNQTHFTSYVENYLGTAAFKNLTLKI